MPPHTAMGRWLGIDYGARRIGLAVSDRSGKIASPAVTLAAAATPAADAQAILAWANENEVDGFVVGLPLNMDGSVGPQAQLCQQLAQHLRRGAGLPVELWDERLSSFEAERILTAAGVKPARRGRRRDALAAQLILQSFLDARRDTPPPLPEPPRGT